MKDIPWPVMKVGIYQQQKYVSSDTYKDIQQTIKDYPEYFPWETLYNSIEQSVHDNYLKEEVLLSESFYPPSEPFKDISKGIWAHVRSVEPYIHSKEAIDNAMEELFVNKPAKEKEYQKQLRQLWDKHYKQFNLKFRP